MVNIIVYTILYIIHLSVLGLMLIIQYLNNFYWVYNCLHIIEIKNLVGAKIIQHSINSWKAKPSGYPETFFKFEIIWVRDAYGSISPHSLFTSLNCTRGILKFNIFYYISLRGILWPIQYISCDH